LTTGSSRSRRALLLGEEDLAMPPAASFFSRKYLPVIAADLELLRLRISHRIGCGLGGCANGVFKAYLAVFRGSRAPRLRSAGPLRRRCGNWLSNHAAPPALAVAYPLAGHLEPLHLLNRCKALRSFSGSSPAFEPEICNRRRTPDSAPGVEGGRRNRLQIVDLQGGLAQLGWQIDGHHAVPVAGSFKTLPARCTLYGFDLSGFPARRGPGWRFAAPADLATNLCDAPAATRPSCALRSGRKTRSPAAAGWGPAWRPERLVSDGRMASHR